MSDEKLCNYADAHVLGVIRPIVQDEQTGHPRSLLVAKLLLLRGLALVVDDVVELGNVPCRHQATLVLEALDVLLERLIRRIDVGGGGKTQDESNTFA